jgi:hypothetical protein
VPAFLLLASGGIRPVPQPPPQQTVDGLQRALEIRARSSYVPSSPIGVRSPGFPEDTRLNAARGAPGNADMDEVIRAKRQQTAASGTRAIAIHAARGHLRIDLRLKSLANAALRGNRPLHQQTQRLPHRLTASLVDHDLYVPSPRESDNAKHHGRKNAGTNRRSVGIRTPRRPVPICESLPRVAVGKRRHPVRYEYFAGQVYTQQPGDLAIASTRRRNRSGRAPARRGCDGGVR